MLPSLVESWSQRGGEALAVGSETRKAGGPGLQERNTLASLSSRSDLLIPLIGQAHRKPEERETQIKHPQGSAPGHRMELRKSENWDGSGGANGE